MELSEIKKIVTNEHKKSYRAYTSNGKSVVVRLWKVEDGRIAIMDKGKRNWGHELSLWSDRYNDWTDLKPVNHKDRDHYKLFVKRASEALKMLSESGLWPDIKENIEEFFRHPENEQRELVNDIVTDSYEKFYCQTFTDIGKYAWVNCHQVFESFASKKCWKSIAWRKRERQDMTRRVEENIKSGKKYSWRWENGYDNTVEIDGNRAWYSEEFRGCLNGHYYLMFDATHAIFYEDD